MSTSSFQDEFGRRVASRLAGGAGELPRDISERLRAARVQALSLHQRVQAEQAPVVTRLGGQLGLHGDNEGASWWRRVASALPLLALALGLIAINVVQNEHRASEVAEVDAALLTDTLPPEAYADPGFVQFLKSGR